MVIDRLYDVLKIDKYSEMNLVIDIYVCGIEQEKSVPVQIDN
jgi:hypothetical protein